MTTTAFLVESCCVSPTASVLAGKGGFSDRTPTGSVIQLSPSVGKGFTELYGGLGVRQEPAKHYKLLQGSRGLLVQAALGSRSEASPRRDRLGYPGSSAGLAEHNAPFSI